MRLTRCIFRRGELYPCETDLRLCEELETGYTRAQLVCFFLSSGHMQFTCACQFCRFYCNHTSLTIPCNLV